MGAGPCLATGVDDLGAAAAWTTGAEPASGHPDQDRDPVVRLRPNYSERGPLNDFAYLTKELEAQRVVVVAGAGVTAASAPRGPASDWISFIESGVERIQLDEETTPWHEAVRSQIALGRQGDAQALADAAGMITRRLGGPKSRDYSRWIADTLGSLEPESPDLIQAIGRLNCPILTTNYDLLITRVLDKPAVTWREMDSLLLIVRGSTHHVGHLHGNSQHPEHMILGSQSYGNIVGNQKLQEIQKAAAMTKTLLFIGMGTGIHDPNIGGVLSWLSHEYSTSEAVHYALVRAQDLSEMQSKAPQNLRYVAYGEAYADLPAFLGELTSSEAALTPPSLDTVNASITACETIAEQIRDQSLIVEHLRDNDSTPGLELLVPPVLLPIPHEQFVNQLETPKSERLHRCSPVLDATANREMLIVGGERVGLTTTLHWLLLTHSQRAAGTIPVVVNFRSLGMGLKPLSKLVVAELRKIGFNQRSGQPLPSIALAIDNFSTRPEKIYSRCLEELGSMNLTYLAIGVRQGEEMDVRDGLAEAGINTELRYVGRMGERDIRKLAALVSPSRAPDIATKTVEIVNREHLPRTPLTVGLLINVILHGEALLATASETALLDAYVSLLLGRGDPHDDARFSLDSHERGRILATLAGAFVRGQVGSMREGSVVSLLTDFFDRLDWDEDPVEVLNNLRGRHLLRYETGFVSFTQASFLHLFAAKEAQNSLELRQLLMERPLYYAPILRHYAALTRDDRELLESLYGLLWQRPIDGVPRGRSFSEFTDDDPVMKARSVDELVDKLKLPHALSTAPPEGEHGDEDWLDQVDDSDAAPFPLSSLEDMEPVPLVMMTLALVSNVLRDSELVSDSELKQEVLKRTLTLWGKFVELLENDDTYRSFFGSLADEISVARGFGEARATRFRDDFVDTFALFIAVGQMSSNLLSRKLNRSLARCFEQDDFLEDPGSAVMGALMGFGNARDGWPSLFDKVSKAHQKVRAVQLLMFLAERAYYAQALSQRDLRELESLLVEWHVSRLTSGSPSDKKTAKGRIKQALQRNRLAAPRLTSGETVLSVGGDTDSDLTDISEDDPDIATGAPPST